MSQNYSLNLNIGSEKLEENEKVYSPRQDVINNILNYSKSLRIIKLKSIEEAEFLLS